ncbi:helix-turn-helix transcriptional regulator [Xenorhabdus sp. XENO-10]|uniref:Helix-turn-helix transcriptional regulator n=1 Tax=Xenorhabdus yunnanensis TaxID=3025878 RepID=A0ABT5LM76_9GAMM|nr:helix-turn-helix transcriptional regulator [Xenorhabdus yunnanensis]MDC9591583.1 helix-turn-helix transcriptional regulator [Xenorhabdus yunnanensis]
MISKRLVSIRKARKLTQESLGSALELDDSEAARTKISHYENERYTPSFDIVCKIADYLDVPESYFYTRDDNFARRILELHKHPNILSNKSDDIVYLEEALKEAEKKLNRYAMAVDAFKKIMPK